jgi:hypothetical protein
MVEKKMRQKGLTVIALMLFIVLVAYLSDSFKNKTIKKNGKVTTAHIMSVEMHIRPTQPTIKYWYIVDDDTFNYTYNVTQLVSMEKLKTLEGMTLPVMYDSLNHQRSELLIDLTKYK